MICHSPLLFEDDCIDSDDNPSSSVDKSNQSGLIDQNDSQEKSEEFCRLERLRSVLMGVPPPPAVTVSQYDATEILQRLNVNYEKFQWNYTNGNVSQIKENEDKAKTEKWPLVRDQEWYNLSYNKGALSEELALLSVKYQERFVGNETSSSVNSFFSKSPVRTASAKKRARRHAWGHSPGRRLSHLARRRHTFSSANLQQNASKSLPDKKKMILVEKRKLEGSKRGRNSVTKSAGNSKNKLPSQSTVLTSKRALFQSPESDKKSNSKSLILSDKSKTSPRVKNIQRSKRALWPNPPVLKPEVKADKENTSDTNVNLNGKRNADSKSSYDMALKKKCLRSLSFSEEQAPASKSMPELKPEALSQVHKQKLLWAVSDALRSEGIKMDHQYSKVFMLELFKVCKEVWLKKCIKENRLGSTTERMSQLANKFSPEVVKKVKIKLEELQNSDKKLGGNSKDMLSLNSIVCNNSSKNVDNSSVQYKNGVKPTQYCSGNDKLSTSDKICPSSSSKSSFSGSGDIRVSNNSNELDEAVSNNGDKLAVSCNFEKDDVNCTEISEKEPEDKSVEKVYRYTKIKEKDFKINDQVNDKKYKTELYIDGFKKVPLCGVNSVPNDNATNCDDIYKTEFSPFPSLLIDGTEESSSCDVDVTGIIGRLDDCNNDCN